MGRNSKSSQHGASSAHHANELLNFRFSIPAAARQVETAASERNPRSPPGRRDQQNNSNDRISNPNPRHWNYGKNSKQRDNRRTARDRASARRNADSSMFYLHSSAEHTFHLTRRSPSKVNKEMYSFNGVDESVSWDAVRMVEQRVPCQVGIKKSTVVAGAAEDVDSGPVCPICLCSFVCPRITKCGHSFCLSCILRHVQTYSANNPYQHVKCPCCGIPIVMDDLRLVSFTTVLPPTPQHKIRLRKLHRHKHSSAPFLPIPDAPMHCSSHFAPTAGVDADAKYSRFNFVDPEQFSSALLENQAQLLSEISSALDDTEKIYLSMALEIVEVQQHRAQGEHEEEATLRTRFANPSAGMYQRQSPSLTFAVSLDQSSVLSSAKPVIIEEEVNDPQVGDCCKGESPPNEATQRSLFHTRYRGDSIGSYASVQSGTSFNSNNEDHDSLLPVSPGSPGPLGYRKKPRVPPQGSMYLDASSVVHFYQAEDGQLIFLHGFNMMCLLSDYAKEPATVDATCDAIETASPSTCLPPFPDFVEGRVLEIEHVCLTPDVRKRMPFLSHIPHYTDVTFVELDLNHILSDEARTKFKADIALRRKRRQSKIQAEKRADKAALREEMERINERKTRLQLIDPNDEFFQLPNLSVEPFSNDIANFGAPLRSNQNNEDPSVPLPSFPLQTTSYAESSISFSDALRRGQDHNLIASEGAFPILGSASDAFPPLGGPSRPLPQVEKPVAVVPLPSGKKKKKGQKLLLFSTGGARGY